AGVATLVIALAMNTGFRRTIQDRLLGVSAHVNLTRPGAEGIEDYRALAQRLGHVDDVRSVAPAIYLTVLLSGNGHARGVVMKGIDPEIERRTDEALHRIVSGKADFAADAEGFDSIVIGHLMAEELKINTGDYVTLTSPEGRLTPYGMVPRSRRFRVAGVFDSGFYDYDANWVFANMPAAQNLAGVGDVASVLEFRIQDVDRAQEAAGAIGAAAGPGLMTTTWEDENRALFRALRLEKLVTALFIGLITFVAGLNILVVLAMTVTDRDRDIAVLMSLGSYRNQVRNIFMLQGLTVGVVGTFTGLVIGYLICWAAGTYHLIPLDPEIYSVPYVPFQARGL
ncbi:MAG: FtsX-like permease family protein, partial [Bryobacteraceae bacterium]